MPSEIFPRISSSEAPRALTQATREFIGASVRPNTRRAYAAQLKAWMAWCERSGRLAFPADPCDVANYLAERGAAGQSVSTMRTIVAAVRAGHDAKGLPFNSVAPVIGRTLQGIRNLNPRLPRQAEPMRAIDVLELMADAGVDPIGRRDAALLALGYVFALRRSELAALDLEVQGDGDGALRITAKSMEVVFAISKTNSGTPETVTVPRFENVAAVKAVEAWIDVAGVRPGEPVLRSVSKSGVIGGRLHPQSIAKIIKARVKNYYLAQGAPRSKAALEAARFSGHSLRVGFCVSAAEGGADIRSVATVTRHRSLAMPKRYSEKADQIRTSPHRLAGVGLRR